MYTNIHRLRTVSLLSLILIKELRSGHLTRLCKEAEEEISEYIRESIQ